LGSNIEPDEQLARALMALLEIAPRLYLTRAIETTPAAMPSNRRFLNALVCFESDLTPAQLKACLNAIEIASGRDRHHPESSRRDRTLDVDILAVDDWELSQLIADCPYLAPLQIDFTSAASDAPAGCPLRLPGGELAGQRATTIDRHPTTGDVRVVEQVIDGLANRLQATLDA
jgi:2-amino-4-hydroxy-6-hydroxymethyldihydropteridine diphosphokinase